MAFRFMAANPALAPLAVALGAGVLGGTWFAVHVLRTNPEVQIARKQNPEPWNQIQQHHNAKLYSPNTDFWQGRVGLPDPRAAFLALEDKAAEGKAKVIDATQRAKAKVHQLKESSKADH